MQMWMRSPACMSCPRFERRMTWQQPIEEAVSLRFRMPYVFIDKLLNELRDELLSAMHAAVEREVRDGRPVDVRRLFRAFTRAAAGKMANPVEVSDRCIATSPSSNRKGPAAPSKSPLLRSGQE